MADNKSSIKIGFLLYSKSQINTFLKSRSLKELGEEFDLTLVKVHSQLNVNGQYFPGEILELPRLNKIIIKFSGLIQLLSLWKYRSRSMNHTVRAMASFGNKKQRIEWNCVVVSEMNIPLIKRLAVRFLSMSPFYYLSRRFEILLRELFLFRKWNKTLSNYDLLIIPFSGHVAMEFGSLVWFARKAAIKSFAVQENWDNLSTKTFILEEPDYFAVWGEQSAGHVRSIHRMFKTEIYVVGSARFGPYYKNETKNLKPEVSNYDGRQIKLENPYILIGGTGDGEDDELLISASYDAMSYYRGQASPTVVYRPHPFTRTPRNHKILSEKYLGLLVDSGPLAGEFGHHNRLVSNCKVLINHFSTLSLEGLISNVFVCVPLFLGRSSAQYRYNHILNEWHHMMGLGLINELLTPRNKIELIKAIEFTLLNETNESSVNVNWICQNINWASAMATNISKIHKT